jgi:hypothetical protein
MIMTITAIILVSAWAGGIIWLGVLGLKSVVNRFKK